MLRIPTRIKPQDNTLDGQQFFTFWDMDDTCVFWRKINPRDPYSKEEAKIKYPQFLLPVQLFQTFAPNQHFGVMTSRPPSDDLVDYTVKMFREELATFGIDIPEDQTVFCGGEKAKPNDFLDRLLQEALQRLPDEFASLDVTDKGDSALRQFKRVQKSLLSLQEIKMSGKNYFIIDFLNKRLQKETSLYSFTKGRVPKTNLCMGLLDDSELNAAGPEKLGAGFFGIHVTGAGNPPKEGSPLEVVRQYYSVNYFHELASKIGLTTYCDSLLNNPDRHQQDHPMLQMAALLYLWQTSDDKRIIKHILDTELKLNEIEYKQVARMLMYIITLDNSHKDTPCKPVDELLSNRAFLFTVTEQYSFIEKKIAGLTPIRATEEVPPLERSKSRGIGNIFRRTSSIKSQSTSATAPSLDLTPDAIRAVAGLELKKQTLMKRLEQLASCEHLEIAEMAMMKLKAINSRSSDEPLAAPSAPSPSRSLSSRLNSASATNALSSTSLTVPAPIIGDAGRRSFTPAASNHANNMRPIASTGSLPELETDADNKTKDTKKLGSGSNIN